MPHLRVVDPPEVGKWEPEVMWVPDGMEPGDMFRWQYLDNPDREAWVIVLPNGAGVWWTTYKAGRTGNLWGVEGTPPDITVTPSINAEPEWHGFITNGEMV